tara:strand:+ start:22800 stop:23120 length:321 start_codon:yes stop_codon:yes gene_type:complete
MYKKILKTVLGFPKNTNFYSTAAKEVLSRKITETIKEKIEMRLSNQALGAIMMALQNSLMNQTDIVPVLQGLHFQLTDNEELKVLNPPAVKASDVTPETNNTTGSD